MTCVRSDQLRCRARPTHSITAATNYSSSTSMHSVHWQHAISCKKQLPARSALFGSHTREGIADNANAERTDTACSTKMIRQLITAQCMNLHSHGLGWHRHSELHNTMTTSNCKQPRPLLSPAKDAWSTTHLFQDSSLSTMRCIPKCTSSSFQSNSLFQQAGGFTKRCIQRRLAPKVKHRAVLAVYPSSPEVL